MRKDEKFYTEKFVPNLEQNMFYTKRWEILHRQIVVKSGTKHLLYEKMTNFTKTNWYQIWNKTCSRRRDDKFYITNWCQISNKTCSIREDEKFYIEKLVSNLEQNMFYTKRWQILHRQIGVKSGTKHLLYEKMTNFT